ncbi:MAG: SGNH/GDSL hydrolase family protein, partial [Eubacteriales bacterium]
IALLLCLILLLCACAQTTTDTPSDTTKKPAEPVTLTIAGNDLSLYTVVYAQTPYIGEEKDGAYGTESDFYRLCAEHIAASVKAYTGVVLPVAQDTLTEVGAYELLVGPTNREQTDRYADMDIFDSCISVENGKLLLGGGHDGTSYTDGFKRMDCFTAAYHAWDIVEEQIISASQSGTKTLDLANGTETRRTNDFYAVACIGDSITEGAGSDMFYDNVAQQSYPAILGRLLWRDCLVFNFGHGCRYMRSDTDNPYMNSTQYAALLKAADRMDLALIMLGTNDALNDTSWDERDDALYLSCAQDLVSSLTEKNANMSVTVMNNPSFYNYPLSSMQHVRDLQNELVGILNKRGVDTYFFDMNTFTGENVGPYRYMDGLHPLSDGYLLMAQALAPVVEAIRGGTYTYTLPEYTGHIRKEWDDMHPEYTPSEGTVSLLGTPFSEQYPNFEYTEYPYRSGAVALAEQSAIEGHRVVDLRIPVETVKTGDTFTVGVRRADNNTSVEKIVLTASYTAGPGWVTFSNVNIDVPQGCYLTFGASNDTLPAKIALIDDPTYHYIRVRNSKLYTNALACEIYGIPLDAAD